jgi:glutamate dehydrogenase
LLSSYFPPALVATRDPLDHPLANAILATVLANDVVNWCGTLMPAGLAQAHTVKESEIFFAWAQGWAALHLQTVLDTVEGQALLVPPQTARAVATQTRAMLKAVVEAALAAPPAMPGEGSAFGDLAALFADRALVHTLYRLPGGAADSLAAAVSIMDRIAVTASFLFSAFAASRAGTARLPEVLAVGLAVRRQCGIDRIERALGACDASPAQHALRRHALDALRQMEHRLLDLILSDLPAPDASRVDADVRAILAESDIDVPVLKDELSLEQAALAVWTLSDSLGKVRVR